MTKQTFSTTVGKPTSEQIAQKAYEIWEQAGRPDGRSSEHWFQAEAELTQRTIISAPASPSPNPMPQARSARQTSTSSPKPRLTAARN